MALLQSGVRLLAQTTSAKTVLVICECDAEGQYFAEQLVTRLPSATYKRLIGGASNVHADIRIHVKSRHANVPASPLQATDPVSRVALTGFHDRPREVVHSVIQIECDFPGGRMVQEIRHCDRVGITSLVEDVAADLTAAMSMEPTGTDDAV